MLLAICVDANATSISDFPLQTLPFESLIRLKDMFIHFLHRFNLFVYHYLKDFLSDHYSRCKK